MAQVVLNEVEARLLGVLIEKELTTPDQYPLTVRALQAGSNQKSNRHPHTEFGEAEVLVGAQGLEAKGLARRVPPGMGARVERYGHEARQVLSLDRAQLAVVAELLLRGPQHPGELRARASRMSSIDTLGELNLVLERLIAAHLVKRLAPSPGTRAERYRELLSSPMAHDAARSEGVARAARPEEIVERHDERAAERRQGLSSAPADGPPAPRPESPDRVAALERRVEALERRLNDLAEQLGEGG